MIEWDKARYPTPSSSDGKKIFASPEWDRIFRQIKPKNTKPEFRLMFFSIKNQYESRGYMTEKQADWVRTCWNFQQRRRSHGRGVSGKTFRELPRCVHERIS